MFTSIISSIVERIMAGFFGEALQKSEALRVVSNKTV